MAGRTRRNRFFVSALIPNQIIFFEYYMIYSLKASVEKYNELIGSIGPCVEQSLQLKLKGCNHRIWLSTQPQSILRLPDEIIGDIIGLIPDLCYAWYNKDKWMWSAEQYIPMETALSISRVSRRFRRIALDTPRLWSTVYVDGRFPKLDLFLTLGRERPLYIKWDVHFKSSEKKNLLDTFRTISHYRRRWSTLEASTFELIYIAECAVLEKWHLNDFPALEKLVVGIGWHEETLDKTAFNSWNMPALKHLALSGFIPHTKTASMLVSFSVSWKHENGPLYVKEIAAFLAECKVLASLSIEIDSGLFEVHIINDEATTILPSVTSFKMKPERRSSSEALLRAIQMPNLIKLGLVCENIDLEPFVRASAHFSSVQSLALFMDFGHYILPFGMIEEYFYNVLDITVCIQRGFDYNEDIGITKNIRRCAMPALRTLKLIGIGESEFRMTVKDVLAFWQNRVCIAGRGGINPLEFITDGKVDWDDDLRSAVANGLSLEQLQPCRISYDIAFARHHLLDTILNDLYL